MSKLLSGIVLLGFVFKKKKKILLICFNAKTLKNISQTIRSSFHVTDLVCLMQSV